MKKDKKEGTTMGVNSSVITTKNMEEKNMNTKNIERVLEKYNISSEELKQRLFVMPIEYRSVFEAKWGIDEAGNYCPTFTLALLENASDRLKRKL